MELYRDCCNESMIEVPASVLPSAETVGVAPPCQDGFERRPIDAPSQPPLPVLQKLDIPTRFWSGRQPITDARFPSLVVQATADQLPLRPGDGNSKMGGDTLRRGPMRGCKLFYVGLVEGRTCPGECVFRATGLCGAANCQGLRFIVDDAFYSTAAAQIDELLHGETDRVAVRLHVTGDFVDTRHVQFWAHQLARHRNLAVWGHTHHHGPLLGLIQQELNDTFPGRAMIRVSESADAPNRTVTVLRASDVRGFEGVICPAMLTGGSGGPRAKRKGDIPLSCCAECGLCMDPRIRTIVFLLIVNGLGPADVVLAGQ